MCKEALKDDSSNDNVHVNCIKGISAQNNAHGSCNFTQITAAALSSITVNNKISDVIIFFHVSRHCDSCVVVGVHPIPVGTEHNKKSKKSSNNITATDVLVNSRYPNNSNHHVQSSAPSVRSSSSAGGSPVSKSSKRQDSSHAKSDRSSASANSIGSVETINIKMDKCIITPSTIKIIPDRKTSSGSVMLGGSLLDVKSGESTPALFTLSYRYVARSDCVSFDTRNWYVTRQTFSDVFSRTILSSLTPVYPNEEGNDTAGNSAATISAIDVNPPPVSSSVWTIAAATLDNRVKILPFFGCGGDRGENYSDGEVDYEACGLDGDPSCGVLLKGANFGNFTKELFCDEGNKSSGSSSDSSAQNTGITTSVTTSADLDLFNTPEKKRPGKMGFSTTPTTATLTPTTLPSTPLTPVDPMISAVKKKADSVVIPTRIKIFITGSSSNSTSSKAIIIGFFTRKGGVFWDVSQVDFSRRSLPQAPPLNSSSNDNHSSHSNENQSNHSSSTANTHPPRNSASSSHTGHKKIQQSPAIHYFACVPVNEKIYETSSISEAVVDVHVDFAFIHVSNAAPPVVAGLFDLYTRNQKFKTLLSIFALKLPEMDDGKVTMTTSTAPNSTATAAAAGAATTSESNDRKKHTEKSSIILSERWLTFSQPRTTNTNLLSYSSSETPFLSCEDNFQNIESRKLDLFRFCFDKFVCSDGRGLRCDGKLYDDQQSPVVYHVKHGLQGGVNFNGVPTPILRHWLVETHPTKGGATSSNSDFPKGGGKTRVVCDLTCSTRTRSQQPGGNTSSQHLSPYRIATSPCGNFVAVLFISFEQSLQSDEEELKAPPTVIAMTLLDLRKNLQTFKLSRGRDVSWLTSNDVVILGDGGLAVKFGNKISPIAPQNQPKSQDDQDKGSAVCWRIFGLKIRRRVIYAMADWTLVLGSVTSNDLTASASTSTAPSIISWDNPKYHLFHGEEASAACERKDSICVGTNRRVLLLSAETMVALHVFELSSSKPVSTFFPIGESCTIFLDGTKLWYIFDSDAKVVLSNVTGIPLAVLPDRLVYINEATVMNSTTETSSNVILSSEVVTKPLFLLETLIVACIKQGVSKEVILNVIKTFGRKTDWLPFKEGEGCGLRGIGITTYAVQILVENNLSELAQYFLGTSVIDRTVLNLPPWVLADRGADWILSADASIEGCWESDNFYSNPTKHDPNFKKHDLLLLDSAEEWTGRSRIGLKGESEDDGVKTLAEILAAERKEKEKEEEEAGGEENGNGWVKDVGASRKDIDNVGGYWRFSEKEEDNKVADLSKYENDGYLYGTNVSLSETSAPCDEGDQGKIRMLYDVVDGGFGVVCNRGGSLDVGFGFGQSDAEKNKKRMKCTIEFWIRPAEGGEVDEDEKGCCIARRVILGEGEGLESGFETRAGEEKCLWKLFLKKKTKKLSFVVGNEIVETDEEAIKMDGWNHICITMDSSGSGGGGGGGGGGVSCEVIFFIKAAKRGTGVATFGCQEFDKTALYFSGTEVGPGTRFTELRVWDCRRSEEGINELMYECLPQAEIKKKMIVKIGGGGQGGAIKKPPLPAVGLAKPRGGAGMGIVAPLSKPAGAGGGGGESAAARRRRTMEAKRAKKALGENEK